MNPGLPDLLANNGFHNDNAWPSTGGRLPNEYVRTLSVTPDRLGPPPRAPVRGHAAAHPRGSAEPRLRQPLRRGRAGRRLLLRLRRPPARPHRRARHVATALRQQCCDCGTGRATADDQYFTRTFLLNHDESFLRRARLAYSDFSDLLTSMRVSSWSPPELSVNIPSPLYEH